MAKKRKLLLRELELVVLQSDFDKLDRLKPSHNLHIGRTSVKAGRVLAIACGLEPVVRWRYHLNPWILLSPTICRECVLRILKDLCKEDAEVVESSMAPLSNRGVN